MKALSSLIIDTLSVSQCVNLSIFPQTEILREINNGEFWVSIHFQTFQTFNNLQKVKIQDLTKYKFWKWQFQQLQLTRIDFTQCGKMKGLLTFENCKYLKKSIHNRMKMVDYLISRNFYESSWDLNSMFSTLWENFLNFHTVYLWITFSWVSLFSSPLLSLEYPLKCPSRFL